MICLDAIFRDPLPTSSTSNVRSDHAQNYSTLHSYNRELLTKNNYPVYMTQQTFFKMLYTPDGNQWSRLESFLASSILIRQFTKAVNEPPDANNPTVSIQISSSLRLICISIFRFVQSQMNRIHIESIIYLFNYPLNFIFHPLHIVSVSNRKNKETFPGHPRRFKYWKYSLITTFFQPHLPQTSSCLH